MTREGHTQSRLPLLVAAGAVAMSLGVFGAMLGARAASPTPPTPPATDEVSMLRTGSQAPQADTAKAPPLAPDDPAHGGAPAVAAASEDWVTVSPVGDLPSTDASAPTVRTSAVRPVRRTYGKPAAAGSTVKRGATEPRIDDKPRY